MIVEDQTEARDFLAAEAGRLAGANAETIETHISMIVLAGERAYKMKRAVKLPYADFSTPDLRAATCEKEVALNSRTAPDLYRGVRRITREQDGTLALDGNGELVDAAVEMMRFDQNRLFDRMAADDRLTPALMTETAEMIARFHDDAPVSRETGGAANMAAVLDINEAGFAESGVFGTDETQRFNAAFRAALDRRADHLDRRAVDGKVRRCHGDLHLRNICLLDGAPRLFDCIEFNDAIATVDTLYDLAFVLMDLWHRDLRGFAGLVANRYCDISGDDDGFVLLPFFMAVRAAVRAHVTATQAAEGAGDGALEAEARAYFDLARSLLDDAQPRLVAIGGLSGTGKTTVAEALSPFVGPPPGARIVESDRVRKAMHGVDAETRLPAKAYRPEVSEKVYRAIAGRAGRLLATGGAVVADAVFDKKENRDLIAGAALEASVPFTGVWLDADAALLKKRVKGRAGGPSDADVAVLDRQLEAGARVGDWRHADAGRPVDQVVDDIRSVIDEDANAA